MKTSSETPRFHRVWRALPAVLASAGLFLLAVSTSPAQDADGGGGGGDFAAGGGGRGGGGGGGGGSRIGNSNGSPTSSLPFPGLAPALISNLGPTAKVRLTTAQRSLDQALAALNRATSSKTQPRYETAVRYLNQAQAHIAEALAYLQAHPELNALPPGPAPTENPVARPVSIPSSNRVPSVNLLAAVEELNTALSQFLNNSASASRTPVLGDLGGFREKIMADIDRVSAEVIGLILTPPPAA